MQQLDFLFDLWLTNRGRLQTISECFVVETNVMARTDQGGLYRIPIVNKFFEGQLLTSALKLDLITAMRRVEVNRRGGTPWPPLR